MGEVLLFEPALFCVKNNSETEIYEVIKHMKQIKQKFPDFYNSLSEQTCNCNNNHHNDTTDPEIRENEALTNFDSVVP